MNEKIRTVITSTGIVLEQNSTSDYLQGWANNHWGIPCQVFKTPDNTYILVIRGNAVAEKSGNFEELACWIDMWALANEYEKRI